MEYLKAFVVGGLICVVGQILIDKTKLTPARILTSFVVIGVLLGAVGLYQPYVDFADSGATVPLSGFGYNLYKGVKEGISEDGWLGIFTGGATVAVLVRVGAIFFGFLAGLLGKPQEKS